MTRSEFKQIMQTYLSSIEKLFDIKNQSYGANDDVFFNFRSTAKRIFGSDNYESMFKILMTYMDKHLVALINKGFEDYEFDSRMKDIIVYSLIAIAMNIEKSHKEDNFKRIKGW